MKNVTLLFNENDEGAILKAEAEKCKDLVILSVGQSIFRRIFARS